MRQNLCYYERALTVRFYRSFLLRMNNYAPQMIVKNALAMAPSRYADFYRTDSWLDKVMCNPGGATAPLSQHQQD